MADNTTLNLGVTGDVITTEDMPVGAPRDTSMLPKTSYKIPRSKIAVGAYDRDGGDVGPGNALDVVSREERIYAEQSFVANYNASNALLQTRAQERGSLVDRRGGSGERGIRR